jgi:phage baseplate assembly protein W
MNGQKDFLGVGWSYPIHLAKGSLGMAEYETDVHQAIKIILGTNPGERVMRPDFGAGLNAFLFEPINTTTIELVRNRVRDALVDWEPRIDVETVKVTCDRAAPARLLIEVHYRIRATNAHHNLVYPFYLEEGTAK